MKLVEYIEKMGKATVMAGGNGVVMKLENSGGKVTFIAQQDMMVNLIAVILDGMPVIVKEIPELDLKNGQILEVNFEVPTVSEITDKSYPTSEDKPMNRYTITL